MFNYKKQGEYGQELNYKKIITHVGIVLFALILIFGSFGIIDQSEIGVKSRLGKVVGTVGAGPYFKLPIIEDVSIIDLKVKVIDYDKNGVEGDSTDTSSLSASSKDLQEVWANIVVNYSVNPANAVDIYVKYRSAEQFGFSVIEPIIRESIKSVTAQYTAEELVTKRLEISDKVFGLLSAEIPEKGAILNQSNLTNFDFSAGFKQAIEKKVTAVQNAEAAKNQLEEKKYLGEQAIVTAEAEAKAIALKSQAASNEKYVSLKALEVQEKAIEKWNGQLPQQFIPGSSLPFINLNK